MREKRWSSQWGITPWPTPDKWGADRAVKIQHYWRQTPTKDNSALRKRCIRTRDAQKSVLIAISSRFYLHRNERAHHSGTLSIEWVTGPAKERNSPTDNLEVWGGLGTNAETCSMCPRFEGGAQQQQNIGRGEAQWYFFWYILFLCVPRSGRQQFIQKKTPPSAQRFGPRITKLKKPA